MSEKGFYFEQVYQPRCRKPEKTVGNQPPDLKGKVMENACPPKRKVPAFTIIQWNFEMERIGNDQGAAHPEAVKASKKTDEEGSQEIKHIRK
jgi:hypothetical protein